MTYEDVLEAKAAARARYERVRREEAAMARENEDLRKQNRGHVAAHAYKESTHPIWRLQVRFERKVQDCWIGAYWEWGIHGGGGDTSKNHIWICLVPMLPIHIWWQRQWRPVGPAR